MQRVELAAVVISMASNVARGQRTGTDQTILDISDVE
jgi:hypothetical protein